MVTKYKLTAITFTTKYKLVCADGSVHYATRAGYIDSYDYPCLYYFVHNPNVNMFSYSAIKEGVKADDGQWVQAVRVMVEYRNPVDVVKYIQVHNLFFPFKPKVSEDITCTKY